MNNQRQIIVPKDLVDLLQHFATKSYMMSGPAQAGSLDHTVMEKVETLFNLDYNIETLDNASPNLCLRYPQKIFIPVSERYPIKSDKTSQAEIEKLTEATATTQITKLPTIGTNETKNTDNLPSSSSSNICNNSLNNSSKNEVKIDGIVKEFVDFASSSLTPTATPGTTPVNSIAPASSSSSNATTENSQEINFDINKINNILVSATYARCRTRFVVPVIIFRGKFICRSATISISTEQYGRQVANAVSSVFTTAEKTNHTNGNGNCKINGNDKITNYNGINENGNRNGNGDNTDGNGADGNSSENPLKIIIDRDLDDPEADEYNARNLQNVPTPTYIYNNKEVIESDIQLLKAFNVKTIADLMVENKKIKYFITCSSSEKADEENRYKDFNILGLPYPGCEFFKDFRRNNYECDNLYYNWNQSFIDARLSIPKDAPPTYLPINWTKYEKWDLTTITINYLQALLKYIQDDKNGLLVHCISGWDRTPLFISLLRLSLWADGLIHQSLNSLEMAYLTLAYDWYLFGHQLHIRFAAGEDIMHFCFFVLKYIFSDDFAVSNNEDGGRGVGGVGVGIVNETPRKRTKTSTSSTSSYVAINEIEEDEQKENIEFDADNSNDSSYEIVPSFSNSKTTTSSSPKSQTQAPHLSLASTTPPNNFSCINKASNSSPLQMGRSSNSKRSRTSPIAVPESRNANTNGRQRHDSNSSEYCFINQAGSVESYTSFGRNTIENVIHPPETNRRSRLQLVRTHVLSTYAQMVGLPYNESQSYLASIGEIVVDQFLNLVGAS